MAVKADNPDSTIRSRMNAGEDFEHDHTGGGGEIGGLLANKLRTHRIVLWASNTAPTAAHVGEAIVPAAGTVLAVGMAYKASTGSQSALRASFFKATGTSGTTSILATINEARSTAGQWARRKATINGTNKGVAAGQRLRVKWPTVGSSVKGGVVAFVDYLIT